MPLPPSLVQRNRTHTRRIVVEGWKRDDGLWDIEGRLTDVKDHDYLLASGLRGKGDAVHDMWVRVTIDRDFNVLEADASVAGAPYMGGCDRIGSSYRRIVGLNLVRGFRRSVAEMFETVKGCSHVTELLTALPSAAIQTMASEMLDTEGAVPGEKPWQLDRCHALESTSETVRRYYPRWYRGDKTGHEPA
jgi:hypothetical protein